MTDWRGGQRSWGWDWSRDTWIPGYEPPPANAGLIAQARRGPVPTEAVWRARHARIIDDEYGRAIAVEWKGDHSQRELQTMTEELRRLRYEPKPWTRVRGGWRAALVH